jgi:hypothetical protein
MPVSMTRAFVWARQEAPLYASRINAAVLVGALIFFLNIREIFGTKSAK